MTPSEELGEIEREFKRILGDAPPALKWKQGYMLPFEDEEQVVAWLKTVPTGSGPRGFEEHFKLLARALGVSVPEQL